MKEYFELHIRTQKYFYIISTLIFISFLYPIIKYDKESLFLNLNKIHHKYLDYILYLITNIGEGYFYIFVFVILTLTRTKNKYLFGAGFGFIILVLIIKLLKLVLFKGSLRPCDSIHDFSTQFVYHIPTKARNDCSFPSGHAGVAFSLLVLMVNLFNPKIFIAILMFLISCIVAYSRVYLGQHFFHDVYAGAFIGFYSTILGYILLTIFPNRYKIFFESSLIDWFLKIFKA